LSNFDHIIPDAVVVNLIGQVRILGVNRVNDFGINTNDQTTDYLEARNLVSRGLTLKEGVKKLIHVKVEH
jgi:hypothetical protein